MATRALDEVQDAVYALRSLAVSSIHQVGGDWPYLTGDVRTPYGLVSVYSQQDFSFYEVILRGQVHQRREQRGRTRLGLAIMAGRWAREVALNEQPCGYCGETHEPRMCDR